MIQSRQGGSDDQTKKHILRESNLKIVRGCYGGGGGGVKITIEMVERASDAYAKERHPSRWDGEPWGLAGQENHRKAIKNALKSIFSEYKLVKK